MMLTSYNVNRIALYHFFSLFHFHHATCTSKVVLLYFYSLWQDKYTSNLALVLLGAKKSFLYFDFQLRSGAYFRDMFVPQPNRIFSHNRDIKGMETKSWRKVAESKIIVKNIWKRFRLNVRLHLFERKPCLWLLLRLPFECITVVFTMNHQELLLDQWGKSREFLIGVKRH